MKRTREDHEHHIGGSYGTLRVWRCVGHRDCLSHALHLDRVHRQILRPRLTPPGTVPTRVTSLYYEILNATVESGERKMSRRVSRQTCPNAVKRISSQVRKLIVSVASTNVLSTESHRTYMIPS
jgi:hypothetical protein